MSIDLDTNRLDEDGYFKTTQSFYIRKPFHAFSVAQSCIELLIDLKDSDIHKDFMVELLQDLKTQLDEALETET